MLWLTVFLFATVPNVCLAQEKTTLLPDRLAPLVKKLRDEFPATKSSALFVSLGDTILIDELANEAPELISIQSITKNVVSLAIGKLIADGKINSLDDPVSTYMPDFSEGKRAKVTIRHVLTHRTGIFAGTNFGLDVENAKDALSYAKITEFEGEPGGPFRYNNTAIQLAGGLVQIASGMPLEQYVDEEIFKPLGIEKFEWGKDLSGRTWAHADLRMRAADLARVGELVAGRGVFRGKRIIAETWFEHATPWERSGDLAETMTGVWWNLLSDPDKSSYQVSNESIAPLVAAGLPEAVANKLKKLSADEMTEEQFASRYLEGLTAEEHSAIRAARIEARVVVVKTKFVLRAVYATGGGGQYLIIDPKVGLVAVQLIHSDSIGENVGFQQFVSRIAELIDAAR